jgi:hypothetical protein
MLKCDVVLVDDEAVSLLGAKGALAGAARACSVRKHNGLNPGETAMRHSRLRSTTFVAALVLAGALAPGSSFAQTATQPPTAALGPYKPVPVTLPTAMSDPSFDTFRKQLAEIAQKKDRTALAQLIAANFFWIPEDTDIADKKLPAIDNVARALGLNGADAIGWDSLAAYAAEASTMADPLRSGVFCSPAEAAFDDKAADELANTTQTDASDWVFPIRDGIEVRSAAKQDAPIIDKLGLYLLRILPDDSPANAVLAAFIKVMTPAGRVGFVPVEAVLPIGGEQLCYVKEAAGWKIAGFLGGEPNQ